MNAINIVLARNEYSPDLTFVEIETDRGESVRIGELISDAEFVKIRITEEDIENVSS